MAKNTWFKVQESWKKTENIWIKTEGIWKGKVIPKGKISGTWKELIQYILTLYSYGNEATSVTGGWIPGYKDGSYVSQSKNADNLYLNSSLIKTNGWVTNKRIDVTSFKTITVTVAGNKENNTGHVSLINNQLDSFIQAIADKSMLVNGDKKSFYLDISNLTGSYYVSVSKLGYGSFYIYDVIMA